MIYVCIFTYPEKRTTVFYHNSSNLFCGHVLYQVLYVTHNSIMIVVTTIYSVSWYLDVKYQVHIKGIAYTYRETNQKALDGVNIAFGPSLQIREGMQYFHQWYFNLPLYTASMLWFDDVFSAYFKYVHSNVTFFVIDILGCKDLGTWLAIQSGLIPLTWMKQSNNKTLTCASQTPFYYATSKHMTLLLANIYMSHINIKMFFTNKSIAKDTTIIEDTMQTPFLQVDRIQQYVINVSLESFEVFKYKAANASLTSKSSLNTLQYLHLSIDTLQYYGSHHHVNVSQIHIIEHDDGRPGLRDFVGKIPSLEQTLFS